MQQIPNSNLLLLVTDPTCDCSIFPPVLQEATEVKYILPICQDVRGDGGVAVQERWWGLDFEAEATLPHRAPLLVLQLFPRPLGTAS